MNYSTSGLQTAAAAAAAGNGDSDSGDLLVSQPSHQSCREIGMRSFLISFRRCAFLILAALAFAPATDALAQSPAPLPNPNLQLITNGTVYAVARLADGSIVFGGYFTSVNGTPRSNIAKLQADGTLDPTWNPSPDGQVLAIATDANGNVYAGGIFTSIGGQSRKNIGRLSSAGSGTADASWNPTANMQVQAIATDASGNVYVGGYFTSIGGQNRQYIAKLSDSGGGAADASWNPSANSQVAAIAIDASGSVYAGGYFNGTNSIGGQSRNYIAKLSSTGSGAADASWNPLSNGPVIAIALDASGSVYSGGFFSSIGGQIRPYIAKLSGTGSGAADVSWNPSANGPVQAIAIGSTGNVYVGGYFKGVNSIGGQSRNYIAKLSGIGSGAADASWDPSASNSIIAIATDTNGNVYAGGQFASIGGQGRLGFARLNSGGMASTAVDAELPGTVWALAAQSSGGTIVGGQFWRANGQSRANILRLQADGTLDPDWNPSANDQVNAIAMDASGNIYAGGRFNGVSSIGGQSRNYVAKLSGTGSGAVDTSWNPSATGPLQAITIDVSGNVYVGGNFGTIGGQSRNNIAKLSSTGIGAADLSWNPSPNNGVYVITLDTSGVYVGGFFTSIGGQNRNEIAKLSSTGIGAADASWNPSTNDLPRAIAVDASGNVYVAGQFTTIGGQARSHIAKLSSTGSGAVDANWNPSANGLVFALSIDGGGRMYVGGAFTAIGGQARNQIARLSSTGTGTADAIWNPAANSSLTNSSAVVFATATDVNGNVYVGGMFTNIGGQGRLSLAALPPTTFATSTTITTVAPSSSVVGQAYTVNFNVTAASGTPSGRVSISDDKGASCGPVTLASGSGSCLLISTVAGSRSLTASYVSDSGAFIASSSTAGHTVNKADTSLLVPLFGVEPSSPGGLVTVQVSAPVATAPGAGTPTGTITLNATGASGCVIPLPHSSCTMTFANASATPYLVTAIYSGDTNFNASSSNVMHGVTAYTTTTNINSVLPGTPVVGQTVQVNYAVSGGQSPSGAVTVSASTGETCAATVASGQCSLSFGSSGARTLAASYAGDVNNSASVSGVTSLTVSSAATALTIVSASPDPSIISDAVLVSISLTVNAPGSGTPSGNIAITAADSAGCSITLPAISCSLTFAHPGSKSISASYSGDGNFVASTSPAKSHTVSNQNPTISTPSAQTFLEDTVSGAIAISIGDAETVATSLTLAATSSDQTRITDASLASGLSGTGANRSLLITPVADANGGPVTITFTVTDSDGGSATSTFPVTITPINDPPSFTLQGNQVWPAGASGLKTLSGFAQVTSFGAANESAQQVQAWLVSVSSDSSGVLSSAQMQNDGTLSYTLTGQRGTATVSVVLQDNGGTANGGNDTSAAQTFQISVGVGLDLSIAITDGTDFLSGGLLADYTITVQNIGTTDAQNATVQDILPANLLGASWSCSASGAAICAASGVGNIADTVNVPKNTSVTYHLSATVQALPEFPLINTATVSAAGAETDIDSSNNSATDTDTVGVFANGFEAQGAISPLLIQIAADAAKTSVVALDKTIWNSVETGAQPKLIALIVNTAGIAEVALHVREHNSRRELRLSVEGDDGIWQTRSWNTLDETRKLLLGWTTGLGKSGEIVLTEVEIAADSGTVETLDIHPR